MRTIIYSRVSTDAQERDGTSLETQERACTEYAAERGWVPVETVRDTASGATLDRPGMERARQLIRAGGADVLLAYAADRLARDQIKFAVLYDEVQNAGVRLEFVTERFEDTAVGKFLLSARAFAAELEREKITERTMRGKAERARSGRLPQGTGKGCYGYRYDPTTGKRAIDVIQASVVRRVFAAFVAGVPIAAIANRLNEEGIPTFTGRRWYPATVHHVLENETYTGRTVYRRTVARVTRDPRTGRRRRKVEVRALEDWIVITDASPSIVDADTFAGAQALLTDPERRARGRRLYDYRLSGRLRCARCGRAMVGQTLQQRYRYYRCRRAFAGPIHDRCDTKYVHADALEASVRVEIARVLANPAVILAEYDRQQSATAQMREQEALQHELAAVDSEKSRLVKLYQSGEVDDAYFQTEAGLLRSRRARLESLIVQRTPERPMVPLGDIARACDRVRAWIANAEGDDFALLAEALQIAVSADRDRAELSGLIPDEYASVPCDAHVRPVVSG